MHLLPPRARPAPPAARMLSTLRRRLLVMLIAPLLALTSLNAWMDYHSADNVAEQQDKQLLAMVPLLADSVIATGDPPLLLFAPQLQEFFTDRPGYSAFALTDEDGKLLLGEIWLADIPPADQEPVFHTEEHEGATWRIVRQRQRTMIGELVVAIGDASDPRQQWARTILLKVLLPNVVLIAAAVFAIGWAVERALRPLIQLKEAVERRSPRDLSALDSSGSPEEVRPLVESLNRLFDLVNAQAESQRRFIADAAHQLRTPLAGLQAQVEAWAQQAAGKGGIALTREQVEKLQGATRRTSQLANQLLALSRADATSMQAQPTQPVDLKALCESALERHLDAATAARIDIGLDVQPATAVGHEWLLRELLANLVDNAVKYTPAGGTVTIRCGVRDGRPFLEVEDDGPGIPAAERPRVLERFYRLQGTGGEGNGLGLAIAVEIARVHRARLELDDATAGRGLRATVNFESSL
jgi:two-component system sensor histidine kinase TctE